jgi:hypothetical protein
MAPIALTDHQMAEVRQAAATLPRDPRPVFLERLALELRGKDLGDGMVHRTARRVARALIWESEQTAFG